jgi:Ca-activated chloride channel family protein
MIEVGGLALLRPWWLAAVPALAALAYLRVRGPAGIGGWARAIEPHLLAALAHRGAVVATIGRNSLAGAFAAILIALALAGPAWQRPYANTFRNLDGTVLVFDVSKSMQAGGHLPEAKNTARMLIEAAGSRQIELIVYAGDAYLVSPFTTDHDALGTTISLLDGRTVPDPGTRPTRALALARHTLAQAHMAGGDVILISDGGNIDQATLSEGQALARASYSLETLFVPAKGPMPDTAPLPDRTMMGALAAAANGASADINDPSEVADEIARRSAVRLGQGDYAVLAWRDLGYVLVAVAALPALLLFRRRG